LFRLDWWVSLLNPRTSKQTPASLGAHFNTIPGDAIEVDDFYFFETTSSKDYGFNGCFKEKNATVTCTNEECMVSESL